MAEDVMTLKLNVEAKSLNQLEANLISLKSKIKDVGVGSDDFKKLQGEIIKAEANVKNLNKSFEGLDKEALAGEFGKLAGGITAAFGGIGAMISKDNAIVGAMTDSIAKTMMVVQGIKGATEAWTAAQKLLNIALSSNPIGLIVTAVGLLVAGIVALISNSDKVKSALDDLGKKFKFLQGPIDIVKAGIDALVQAWRNVQKFFMGDDAYEKMIDERIKNMRDKAKKDKANRDLEEMRRNKEKNEEELKKIQEKEDKAKEIADKAAAKKKEREDKEVAEAMARLADKEAYLTEEQSIKDAYYELDKQKAKDNADQLYEIESKHIQEKLDVLNSYRNSTGQLSEEDKLLYEQILQKKAESNKEYLDTIAAQEEERRKAKAERDLQEYEFDDELFYLKQERKDIEGQSDIEAVQAQIDNDKAKQQSMIATFGEYAKYSNAWISLDNKIADNEKKLSKLKREREKQALAATADILSQAQTLFEENTVAYKLIASAQVIINGALAIMGAWATFMQQPGGVAGAVLAGVTTAIVVATGLAQLAKINNVEFADGGVFAGPSHAMGGILTPFGEVEGGEGIINNRSMSNYSLRNMASAANVAGGGVNFGVGDGTIRLSPESISQLNDKKVYVMESDITSVQNKVKVYEANASY